MLPGESGFTITFYTSFFKLLMISLMVLARFSAYFRNKAFCEPSHTVLLSAVRTILTVIGYELWPSVSTLILKHGLDAVNGGVPFLPAAVSVEGIVDFEAAVHGYFRSGANV